MRRSVASLQSAAIWLLAVLAAIGLVALQRAARSLMEQSSGASSMISETAPFVDLSNVEIRARQSGRETLSLNAARLTLFRDMRTVTVEGISNGLALQGGVPALAFNAGSARFVSGFSESASRGQLSLAGTVTAKTRLGGRLIALAAPGLTYRWPGGEIVTDGLTRGSVGGLGQVSCSHVAVNPTTRDIAFGPLEVTVSMAALLATSPPAPAANGSSSPAPKPNDKVVFQATQSGRWDDQHNTLTIEGPVTVKQGPVTMVTVGVIYDNTTKIAHAQAPVKIADEKNTLSGTNGSIDFNTHVATLDGDVHLSAAPDQTDKKASNANLDTEARQPTQMYCDHIAYNYRTKLADADGHLKVVQTSRTVTATTGHYDANAELVTLHGNVDARSTDGKHLTAPDAVVSVKHGNEWIEVKGPIEYELPLTDEDNPIPPDARKASKSGAGSGGPSKGEPSKPTSDQPPPPPSSSPSSPAPNSTP